GVIQIVFPGRIVHGEFDVELLPALIVFGYRNRNENPHLANDSPGFKAPGTYLQRNGLVRDDLSVGGRNLACDDAVRGTVFAQRRPDELTELDAGLLGERSRLIDVHTDEIRHLDYR